MPKRKYPLDEPIILEEESKAHGKWVRSGSKTVFPYKYTLKTYCIEKGIRPEDVVGKGNVLYPEDYDDKWVEWFQKDPHGVKSYGVPYAKNKTT